MTVAYFVHAVLAQREVDEYPEHHEYPIFIIESYFSDKHVIIFKQDIIGEVLGICVHHPRRPRGPKHAIEMNKGKRAIEMNTVEMSAG